MKSVFLKTSVLLIVVLLSTSCVAQNATITSPSGKLFTKTELDNHIKEALEIANAPGLSIAIVNGGEMVYYNVFGVTNTKTKEAVTPQTIFEGASLSKPAFAYFALKMAEKGLFDLDTPLHQYLPHPGIAEKSQETYKKITARMVLSHSSGFPNHAKGKLIELPFTPGEGFLYSGEGYQYLAAVIATLKGVNFKSELNTLFKEEVTTPLQMEHTTFVWDEYLELHKAFGHTEEGIPTQNNPSYGGWSGKTFNAFSSVHSEAGEYANFLIALLNEKGLSSSQFKEMYQEHTVIDKDNPLRKEVRQTGWGLALAQKPTPYGMMHLHTGNNHDFQAYMMVLPEQKFGITFFMNGPNAIPFIEHLNKAIGPIF